MMQTLFFKMFLNVAHYNGSLFRKYSLCKLSTAVQTSANMQYCITPQFQIWSLFRIRTRAFIRAGCKRALWLLAKGQTLIYKRKHMQKGKMQRKVGNVRWRERERGGGGTGRNKQKAQARGLAKWSTRAWWIQLRAAVTRAREVFDESLVDAADSGDSAFPSGDFSVSRSRRPFSASQASEQLSLVSASREGPINFPFKFSGCWTCGALVANWESSK